MGIKTKISKKQLPKKYQKYNLIETVDGISDSVYLLDNIYVLKLFENQTKQQILNEQNLLNKFININKTSADTYIIISEADFDSETQKIKNV